MPDVIEGAFDMLRPRVLLAGLVSAQLNRREVVVQNVALLNLEAKIFQQLFFVHRWANSMSI